MCIDLLLCATRLQLSRSRHRCNVVWRFVACIIVYNNIHLHVESLTLGSVESYHYQKYYAWASFRVPRHCWTFSWLCIGILTMTNDDRGTTGWRSYVKASSLVSRGKLYRPVIREIRSWADVRYSLSESRKMCPWVSTLQPIVTRTRLLLYRNLSSSLKSSIGWCKLSWPGVD